MRFHFLLSWRRHYRWCLFALANVLLIVLAGQWMEAREIASKTVSIEQSAKAQVLGLRGIVEKYDYLPFAAAQHPDVIQLLHEPTDPALTAQVNQYFSALKAEAGVAALYVISVSGVTLAASNWNTRESFVGQSYQQRPYFEDALSGRTGLFYGLGLTTGASGLFIAKPVRSGSKVIGIMVAKLSLDALERVWTKSVEPLVLQDSRGIVFLSSVPAWLYQSRSPLGQTDLRWLQLHSQYGSARHDAVLPWQIEKNAHTPEFVLRARVNGQRRSYLASETYLPELGWTLIVTSDLEDVRQAKLAAILIASLLSIVVLLGILYWHLHQRRLIEQQQARRELEQRVLERTHDLQEAHAFRKSMEDSLLVGMIARDHSGKIIYVNNAFCDMVGSDRDALLNCQPPYPYWHPDELEKHWRNNEQLLNGHSAPHGFESRIRNRAGEDRYIMVYTAALIDSNGVRQGWMSSIVDITVQKRIKDGHHEQERKLQRSARLASLGEMASTLAHELNQPLMAISNFALAARAMAHDSVPPMLGSALQEIVAQSKRASDIVKRVRALINPQRGAYEIVSIHAVISDALAMLQHEIQQTQTLVTTEIEIALPATRGDKVLLQQVLINLCQNAMQAMEALPLTQHRLTVSAKQVGRTIQVRVADLGPGIAAHLVEQVFTSFFTTKPDGLGLGLNICRTVIEAHGGRIFVENKDEGGAVFLFTLPISQ
ncbi:MULTISPECIES: ATP-binding protein [unclassified Undibacterium]|uniref:sensor histidine kinase n=1 Tax=unclassified Undibacterium TaxID=2630295 RepID=UPI002AC9C981|nr:MULTISPECIES: ATP-binding protein [unclassified Undibacterium]MEB0140663.1 ATP-binding protein [Undibacterium sp. CCC2.1]MEB0172427.1 ATP-binding protein [Undibacterium sp. CCC1.1]MEB0177683.1 ATP-binding protein [Undibacterium sp. CCC3.4]MEB0215549.1 ATP-binding protein [Undibacterium sp. 5I2]WPX43744.1 ATP-binding protein [Undibacterium sp. CCC3.4]